MEAGSYFPSSRFSSLYAMAGDDCSLFFDLDKLTPKQQQDHEDNVALTAMLQVALACIGHQRDHLALYDDYLQSEWAEMLARYHGFFKKLVPDVIPVDHFSFHPKYTYYESVADYAKQNPTLTDVVNLYMSSGSNSVIHRNPALLALNRRVNSKQHFAENAPAYGLPTPATLVTSNEELGEEPVKQFFASHGPQLMLKLPGLAGARNVTVVDNIDDCIAYTEEYSGDMVVILQEKLALEKYTEMTVDLFVSADEIRIANTRKILFADGLWVGNLIGKSVSLSPEQIATLLKVGEYARDQGYGAGTQGSNCGIDFFIGDDGSVIVTEINARWTGGLFPAEILKQARVQDDSVAFFDIVPVAHRSAYTDFVEQHLYGESTDSFSVIPLGFGCHPVTIEETDYFYSWQVVIGDFAKFQTAKLSLPDGCMPTADLIRT